jgi:KamA family protein
LGGLLNEEQLSQIEVVASVFPFRTNDYVAGLIDWHKVPDDPIFRLTFPHPDMLSTDDFSKLSAALRAYGRGSSEVLTIVSEIREKLNPHPAGQLSNIPSLDGNLLKGLQHKYAQTVLFFPSQGQICHSFCTFCFRWPQFVMDDIKFAANSPQDLISYLRRHPEVIDVLFTGGDPMVMRASILASYIEPLLAADVPNLSEIRIGTKSLSYWPYRFLEDRDSDEVLALFERVVKRGIHLSIMAHVNHWREMTEPFCQAVKRIQGTGAVVRTQAPIMHHINDDAEVWSKMWTQQVNIGMVPFYMFIPRDTGSRHYFEVPLAKAYTIFQQAYQQQSGLGRTARGPVMSTDPGKIEIVGVTEINAQKIFVLRFLQARKPELVLEPFLAEFNDTAAWLDDLKPAFNEHFLFEKHKRSSLSRISEITI